MITDTKPCWRIACRAPYFIQTAVIWTNRCIFAVSGRNLNGLVQRAMVLGRTHRDCNEYYCCANQKCEIGTYDRLLQPLEGAFLGVPDNPYRITNENEKKVNCSNFAVGEGKRLFEYEIQDIQFLVEEAQKRKNSESRKCKSTLLATFLKTTVFAMRLKVEQLMMAF